MPPQQTAGVGPLSRTMSAQVASSSHALLQALEGGNIDEVRAVLFNTESSVRRSSLLMPSYECRHALRTPLMSAVQTGNFAVFKTVLNAFNDLFTHTTNRSVAMKMQLFERDRDGWNVAMHAARAGHVVVMETILKEVFDTKATACLTARDHQQMTLVMHAAAAGNAAAFQEVVKAVDTVLPDAEMADHMLLRSGDDQTLLMIAAASADKMTFKACVEAVRLAVTPHDFRELMKVRDADGMTFLMHAANPASPSASSTKKAKHSMPKKASEAQPVGGNHSEAFSRAATTGQIGTRVLAHSESRGVSQAPQVRGPGGDSEDVLRRHSLQKSPAIDRNPQESSIFEDDDLDHSMRGGKGDGADESKYGESHLAPAADHNGGGSVPGSTNPAHHRSGPAATKLFATGHKTTHHQQQQLQQEQPQLLIIPTGKVMDPRVPVLKAAVALNKDYLWKEQVRDILTAKDSWGRTLVSHGILSGNPQLFELSLAALRADVLDEEVEDLVTDVEHLDQEKPLVVAKEIGGSDMAAAVEAKLRILKRDVDLRAQASTFEAKIQSFIPGKLIVIFQLLLPEVGREMWSRLALLLAMSVCAPILAWAKSLVTRRRSQEDSFIPRRSVYSYCLAAPAMFVWGTGTSDIFSADKNVAEGSDEPEGFGWPESRSAVVLAVGAIVIPAVDGFVNSKRVEQWNDKFSFSRWRFSRQAEIRWKKLRAQANKSTAYTPDRLDPAPVSGRKERLGAENVPAPICEVAETKDGEQGV